MDIRLAFLNNVNQVARTKKWERQFCRYNIFYKNT